MVAKMSVLSGVLLINIFIGQGAIGQQAGSAKPGSVYVPMPKDIQCTVRGLSIQPGDSAGPHSTVINGTVESVICWVIGSTPKQEREIPLASTQITRGTLSTKSFGKLRVAKTTSVQDGLSVAIRRDEVGSFRLFLQQPVTPPAEDADWDRANAVGTVAAYKEFLSLHSSSQRVQIFSGQASYRMVLSQGEIAPGVVRSGFGGEPPTATTLVGSDALSVTTVLVKIEGKTIQVGIARAKSLGLVNALGGGQVLEVKAPGPVTVCAGQDGDLLAIEDTRGKTDN